MRKFHNKRSLIIAAATRFFKNLDHENEASHGCLESSSTTEDLHSDFMTIYRHAHDLYSRQLSVQSETLPAPHSRRNRKRVAVNAQKQPLKKRIPDFSDPRLSYPSPGRSSSSPEPLSPHPSPVSDLPTCRKRKNHDEGYFDEDNFGQTSPVLKRYNSLL